MCELLLKTAHTRVKGYLLQVMAELDHLTILWLLHLQMVSAVFLFADSRRTGDRTPLVKTYLCTAATGDSRRCSERLPP